MNSSFNLSFAPGSLLIGLMADRLDGKRYIAEIKSEKPLQLKIEESGSLSYLELKDFVILERESSEIQGSLRTRQGVLESHTRSCYGALLSGLHKLGILDGKISEVSSIEKTLLI